MEWGIFLVTALPPFMTEEETIQNSVAYAVAAENMGFDHAWVLEHHFTRYGLVGSALMHASFILGHTTKLKVGTAVQVLPLHHPVQMAEQVALIDHLSGGRFIFGVGRGSFLKDFKVFGADMGKSRESAVEALEIVRRCWVEGRCQYDGQFHRFPEVEIYPRPITRPHPQLYTVARSPESLTWAAKEGIPLIFGHNSQSDEQKAVALEQYGMYAEAAGHDPSKIPHIISCLAGVSRNGDDIKKASWDHLVWWYEEGTEASGLHAPDSPVVPSYEWRQRERQERVLRGMRSAADTLPDEYAMNPIGSPQECIDKLNTTVEITGVTRFILGFEAAGRRADVLRSMQMFKEEVIPHVSGARAQERSLAPSESLP